jgi:S-adenosylmethionine hydrolase
MNIITFISDFGPCDWFAGAVKGEILKINYDAFIVDITHNIVPQDVHSAAFLLKCVYKSFPEGTVHLVVVDPGVGSSRKPIIAQSQGYYFVGPDNGVFSYVLSKSTKVYKIKEIDKISYTFHARDVFGPAAARLSKGMGPDALGSKIENYIKFPFPKITRKKGKLYGKIIYIDHFGNCITNIPNTVKIKEFYILNKMIKVKKYYGASKTANLIALRGSCGFYEVASPKANAQKILNAKIGMKIVVRTNH